jgi:uncharacterized repeat protein (TIGR02543 family)
MTVYAQWTAAPLPGFHTVTFKLNDGTETNWAVKTVTAGSAIGAADFPANPTRSGYNFAGWNTQANGGGSPFTASTTISADMTVYARWTIDTGAVITLNFDTGDGAFSQAAFTVYKSGGTGSQTVSISGAGYTKPRWEVDGDQKGTGTGITINAADYGAGKHVLTLLVIKNGVTWSKELPFTVDAGTLRTVIFRTNDGAEAIYASRTADVGSAISGFPANPTRYGYTFSAWNTQANGGGSPFTSSSTVSADMTVYAQWNLNIYTVTFMSNYPPDTTLAAPTVTFPETAVPPAAFPVNPTRSGYNFTGWNTQANGGGSPFTASTTVSGNITVYAQWAHEEFTITLNFDAGDGAFSQAAFTVYKSGGTGSQNISISNADYTNPRWEVDGDLKGTGTGITINAADYGAGRHILTLFVTKGGLTWSKELPFTVVN